MPAYNEEACIGAVIRAWTAEFDKVLGTKYRLVVVNDGSRDRTGTFLDTMAQKNKRLIVLHQPNGGHGSALLNAYHYATGLDAEYVFHVDSDDQFRPADFARLWALREQSKFLLGFRQKRYDALHRLVITRILRGLLWLMFGAWIKDSNVPFRLIRRDYLERLLSVLPAGVFAPNVFLSVLAARDGQNTVGMPVHHEERKTGTVSIVRWKLIKVCFRCARELWSFRAALGNHLKALKSVQSTETSRELPRKKAAGKQRVSRSRPSRR